MKAKFKMSQIISSAAIILMLTQHLDACACGVDIKLSGESFQTAQFGNCMASIEGPSIPLPKDRFYEFAIEHTGWQDYTFYYSGKIKKIRLWMGAEKVYEGAPIASYKGTKRPLKIGIQADGDFSVHVGF